MAVNKEKLSLFFDQACAISLYIIFFCIPFSSALINSFFGLALFFFIGRLLTKRGLLAQFFKTEKLLLFFFVALGLSLVHSGPFIFISLRALFLKWGKYIVFYFIISQTIRTAPRIKYALAVFLAGAVLIILDCFSQLFLNREFLCHRHMALHISKVLAVTGPFNHNNGLASYLACALIVMLYWVFSKGSKVIKSIAIMTFFSGIFILICAYSRGGWIAFILAIIVLACFLKKFRFLGFSLAVTLILGFKSNWLKFLLFKDSGRFELWAISWRMIKEHPLLGNGVGTFMAWFRNFSATRSISYAHNCFLQIWAEAGLISLVLFYLFIIKTLWEGFLFYKKTKDPVLAILVCAILAYFCHSFFDTILFSSQLAFLFWALMGLLKGSLWSHTKDKAQVA